jgi:hypothetical protein
MKIQEKDRSILLATHTYALWALVGLRQLLNRGTTLGPKPFICWRHMKSHPMFIFLSWMDMLAKTTFLRCETKQT